MGGIHGNKRFQCEKCEKAFSWRLDLIEHHKECMEAHKKKKSKTELECYLLEFCFLCGLRVLGECSEEASIINGSSQLKYSQQPVMEVLAKILDENEIKEYADHTHISCKACMDKINEWDAKELQLKDLGRDISNTFRKRKLNHKEVEPNYKVHRQKSKSKSNDNIEEQILYPESSIGCYNKSDILMTIDDGINKGKKLSLKQEFSKKPTDSKNREFHCDCGKIMVGMDALVHHQLTSGCKVHTNRFPCKYCEASFSERKLLIQHKKLCDQSSQVNGGYQCDICCRRFLKRGRVETHKRNVHKIGTVDQQLCSYCGRTFGSSYNIKNHLAREHGIGEIEKISCPLCGGKFCDKSSLRNHMINIHKEKKFECELCGKKFPTAGTMNHHMNEIHNDTYTYDCNICGQQFRVGFKYRYHMRKMHNNVQYGCDSCSRTFVMKGDLYRHVRGVHMGIRDPKRYPCKICGRLFPSLYKVKRHMGSHMQQQQQQHMIASNIGIQSGSVGDSGGMYRMSVEEQTSAATASITIEEDSSCGGQQGHLEHGNSATISVHHLLQQNVDMTNLSSNMLVREVGSANLVAAQHILVSPMPGIIVSGSGRHQGKLLSNSRVHETITLHTETQDVCYDSQVRQTCEDFGSIDVKKSADMLLRQALSSTSTMMPLHQMIVIHEASSNSLVEQHAVTPSPPGPSIGDTTTGESNDQIHAPSLPVTPCNRNTAVAVGNVALLSELAEQVGTCIETDTTLRQLDQTDTLLEVENNDSDVYESTTNR